ncbi:glycosyltransferase family 4 protein [bacterium]|nr:glycosyltransferase family 4 protein [bacterium]
MLTILMIDKYYFVKGGAERYVFDLTAVLEKHGHRIVPFSMQHTRNLNTPFSSFFVRPVEFNVGGIRKLFAGVFIASRILYSLHAKRRLARLIRKVRPDIAHVHMIDHQISPSILHVLRKFRIPVIQTVHQYKLICPNYRLYNMRTRMICEKCLDRKFWHPVFDRCHKDSVSAGLLLALEACLHRILRIYERNIDVFHVPSRFIGSKLVEGGFPAGRIRHLFYTIDMDQYKPVRDSRDYFLYYGRLSGEKGIHTLLKAMKNVRRSMLEIAGDGELREALEATVRRERLTHVRFSGYLSGPELRKMISLSRFVVVPSEWYENSPLTVYEAFALGKPVIGSAVGGIPELVVHGRTGLLFQPGDAETLSRHILYLLDHPSLAVQMGRRARRRAEALFGPENHYHAMMRIYRDLLGKAL